MMTRLLSLLVLSLFLVSCGQGGGSTKKQVTLTKEKLVRILKSQTFECGSINGGDCPAGIARLFILNPKSPEDSHVCSGFLNGDNKVVTNNHCVSTLNECRHTYISIYNGSSIINVRCEDIIETKIDEGALSMKGVDFTVMELDKKVSVKAMPVAPASAYVGEEMTAWVIDHLELDKVRITELNCTYQSKSNSMLMSRCPVIQGNSGSPLVNKYGEVAGVIWGTTVDEDIDASVPLSVRRSLNETALVTDIKHFRDYLSSK